MKLNIAECKEIIMNTFIDNTEDNDFYDADMFINDVKCSIQAAYMYANGKLDIDDAECLVDFECAVIDAIREIDIYEWYGSAGCVIIVAELFDFAKDFFNEAD